MCGAGLSCDTANGVPLDELAELEPMDADTSQPWATLLWSSTTRGALAIESAPVITRPLAGYRDCGMTTCCSACRTAQ